MSSTHIGLRATLIVLSSAACVSCSEKAHDRPNVVLVVVDTLRADHTSVYGYGRDTTPILRQWSEGGTVFEHAWAMSSWTMPSVAMLFTGTARIDNSGVISAGQRYLAELFRARGYRTAAVIGNELFDPVLGSGFQRSFDEYLCAASPPSSTRARRPPAVEWSGNCWKEPATSAVIAEKAIAVLDRVSAFPFFLFVHFMDPHAPYRPVGGPRFDPDFSAARRADLAASLGEENRPLLTEKEYEAIERERALYDSEVAETDEAIGRLFDALRRRHLEERTLVLITADHGKELWQRPTPPDEVVQAFFPALYQGHGIMLHSEQVRVPLIVRGPGIPAATRRRDQVTLLDVVPTILGAAKIAAAEPLEGRDLFAEDGTSVPDVYGVCSRSTTVTVDGRWRLHYPREYRMEKYGALPQLYDLSADPGERRPLEDPERTAALIAKVKAWRTRHAPPPSSGVDLQPEDRERLRALGYLGEADPGT